MIFAYAFGLFTRLLEDGFIYKLITENSSLHVYRDFRFTIYMLLLVLKVTESDNITQICCLQEIEYIINIGFYLRSCG